MLGFISTFGRLARLRSGSSPRDLRRDLAEQPTEEYWRRRARERSRRMRLVAGRYRVGAFANSAHDVVGAIGGAIPTLLRAAVLGGLILASVIVLEMCLAYRFDLRLFPESEPISPLGALPSLAAQVTASLLGFYLASVGIVLGTSYPTVSAEVRELVFRSARTKLYLGSVGISIGAGLTLVLLESFEVSFGYLTVGFYALIVAFGGWAFAKLAFGAFNLFNPIVLGAEPLRILYRAINRLDSKGLAGDEAIRRATSLEADRALRVLAELIDLAAERASLDRNDLVRMVEMLLVEIELYARKKHLLVPESEWFIREVVYPRWVEARHTEVSIALETSTPLQIRMEPETDWLEKRSAELVGAAIEACVIANDRDAALRIMRSVEATARLLAENYRIDDSITFSAIIRDRCWTINSENDAAVAVFAEPPMFLTNSLLGWHRAITSWPDDIREVVSSTEWDRPNTAVVPMRGPARVRTLSQSILKEVRAEHEIQGNRTTPDWYLRYALADACILSLREYAKQLPKVLDDFTRPTVAGPSPEAKAIMGAQSLQTLAKADLVSETISKTVIELEVLRLKNEPQKIEEIDNLPDLVQSCRASVLEQVAEAITKIRPESSQSSPDLFGGAFFSLVHHTELAIACGDVAFVKRVFPRILGASMNFQGHMWSFYQPPTYEFSPALLDPTIDLLELSGLATVYEVLRSDRSADPIRRAWRRYIQCCREPKLIAKGVLTSLDLAEGNFSLGVSQRDIVRTGWEQRLIERVMACGYAAPEPIPFGAPPKWSAPKLIKLLGISEYMPRVSLPLRTIFAARVIGPLSGESEQTLRARVGLRRYFERLDRFGIPEKSDETGDAKDNGDTGDTS